MARPEFVVVWRSEDSVEALRRAYREEADGEVRTRLHGLWRLRRERRLGEVAEVVGVHPRTVQRWVRWYRDGGLAAVRSRKRGGRGEASWLSPEQQAAVVEQAATGAFHTAADVRQWISDRFGVSYRPKGIYRLLGRLGCRPKVPRPVREKANLAEQAAWKRGGSPRRSGQRA
jgi:transposase